MISPSCGTLVMNCLLWLFDMALSLACQICFLLSLFSAFWLVFFCFLTHPFLKLMPMGMCLLDPPSRPVPSRPAPTPSADGQTQLTQALYEGKTCGIDGTGIFEWDASLLLHLWMPKLGGGLLPFGLIAVVATEYEV